jgi:hypothetical protein
MAKKPFPKLKSPRFTPVFFSNNFIVLTHVFWSLIHFDLIFIYGIKIHSFICEYPDVSVPLVEKATLSAIELS